MTADDTAKPPVGPVIILVEPQLGENIGMCARAMWNCGLTELRLVKPRDGWPSEKARATASGADVVIDRTRVFERLEDAVADLQMVLATTGRPRGMTTRVMTPWAAAPELRDAAVSGLRVGVMFGREAGGLNNDEVALAHGIVAAPLNPEFKSLNLAQAVFMIAYEWLKLSDQTTPDELVMPPETRPASRQEMLMLYEHLESELDACGFLRVADKRPTMVRNIRNMFGRAGFTEQEVRTFRGIISGLVKFGGGRSRPKN